MTDQIQSGTQPEQLSTPRRRRPGESWQGFVERQIQEAQAQGAFDNLPGHGKPLPPETVNPYEGASALAQRFSKTTDLPQSGSNWTKSCAESWRLLAIAWPKAIGGVILARSPGSVPWSALLNRSPN